MTMNQSHNTNAKSMLSRMMASENILVVHSINAKTASFDVKNRVLTLPVLKDMSDEMYDMFIGHEVSHALNTPFTEEDEKSIKERNCLKAVYDVAEGNEKHYTLAHSYINIIEDARIERMIKDKFQGLRRDFFVGYRELHNKDFFGIKYKNVNEMSFIDRINLYFKIGNLINVNFSEEEIVFVNMIENTVSFDDVVDVTKKVWNYCKDKKSESVSYKSDIVVADGEDGGYGTNQDNQSDKNQDNNGKKNGSTPNNNGNRGDWSDQSIMPDQCLTQQSFDKNFSQLITNDNRDAHHYYQLPNLNMKYSIVDYKEMIDKFNVQYNYCTSTMNKIKEESDKFIEDSNAVVNILCQSFMAKKAAKDHHRGMIHRTGVIDTVKMMNYKFTDDIFMRIRTIKKGKSHGLVFFVDMSGSMAPVLEDTFKQMIQLVLFCKKVNIPFEVYGFTTKNRSGLENDSLPRDENATNPYYEECRKVWHYPKSTFNKDLEIMNPFTLVNLFSSRMNRNEITQMIFNCFSCTNYYKSSYNLTYTIPPIMHLSSTPLLETFNAAMDIIPLFKSNNKLDIVHSIFLTDGAATGINISSHKAHFVKNGIMYDLDTSCSIEDGFADMVMKHTGAKAICFFLTDPLTLGAWVYFGHSRHPDGSFRINDPNSSDYLSAAKTYSTEGWCIADNRGHLYSEKFIIHAKTKVKDDDLEDLLSGKKTTVGIRNAFVKAMNKSIVSRVMLNRFIDLIATE